MDVIILHRSGVSGCCFFTGCIGHELSSNGHCHVYESAQIDWVRTSESLDQRTGECHLNCHSNHLWQLCARCNVLVICLEKQQSNMLNTLKKISPRSYTSQLKKLLSYLHIMKDRLDQNSFKCDLLPFLILRWNSKDNIWKAQPQYNYSDFYIGENYSFHERWTTLKVASD